MKWKQSHSQFQPEERGSIFLQNLHTHLPHCMGSAGLALIILSYLGRRTSYPDLSCLLPFSVSNPPPSPRRISKILTVVDNSENFLTNPFYFFIFQPLYRSTLYGWKPDSRKNTNKYSHAHTHTHIHKETHTYIYMVKRKCKAEPTYIQNIRKKSPEIKS